MATTKHFTSLPDQTWPKTVQGFYRASVTVFTTPSTPGHDDKLYLKVAKNLRLKKISEQNPLLHELAKIEAITHTRVKSADFNGTLSTKQSLGLMGIFMQFASYLPQLRPYCMTPFQDTEDLYQAFTVNGNKNPLQFSQQLEITLGQTSGDLLEALWRLFITSRLYARWFDTSAISSIPPFGRQEIIERMENWSRSVAACKPYGSCPDQDSSGDVYYCWTHALAKVLYKTHGIKLNPLTYIEIFALHNGTWLNHALAHRYKQQKLVSDHTVAASYGNTIGEALVQEMRVHKSMKQ